MDFFNMIKQLVVLMSLIFAQTSGFNKTEWIRKAADQDPENSTSYLDWPRIHFYGTVLVGPPTGNNDCENYDIETFDERLREDPSILSWNPYGSGIFQFLDCKVSSVCYRVGNCVYNSLEDSLIGKDIINNINRSQANIVDLDPAYQTASMIFGLTLHIPGVVTGHLLEVAASNLFGKIPKGEADESYGADFLSLLVDVKWEDDETDSQIVEEFRDVVFSSPKPNVLSIKFNVELDSTKPYFKCAGFQNGRIVGTIGLAGSAEPLHSLRHRQVKPLEDNFKFGRVYFRVFRSRRKLLIDIANAIKLNLMGLPDPDFNQILQIAYPSNETTNPISCKTEVEVVGLIDYSSGVWYQQTAGVVSVPETTNLTLKQLNEISNRPLMIRRLDRRSLQCVQVILAERSDGIMIDVMGDRIFRQDPGDKWQVDAFSTKFGTPVANFSLQIKTAEVQDDKSHCGPNNTIPFNLPTDAVKYSNMTTTNKHGIAVFHFTGESPRNPRRIVDGQLYFFDILADVNHPVRSNQPIAVHMYDDFMVSEGGPTWNQDIYPIFKLYANMYPSMTDIINLASYEDVRRKIKMIKVTMTLPFTDPAYMPVTRDLSGQKRQAILKWLDRPKVGKQVPSSLEELKKNLQIALELELSTIPPYLTALFSIKKDHNTEIASILESIVTEEMLHMTLVANILNSICGNPILNDVRFLPRYPAKLPGGIHPHLTVPLGRLSKGLIEDVFMKIEEPDYTLPITLRQVMLQDDHYEPEYIFVRHHHHNTIGQFYYKKIWRLLRELALGDENLFKCGNSDTQIDEDDWYSNIKEKPFPVRNIEVAGRAIHKIITEGEGSSATHPYDSDGELSHYYKFFEIVMGNKVEVGKEVEDNYTCNDRSTANTGRFCSRDGKLCHRMPYTLTGERVPFHEDGIWPILNDPEGNKYPVDSEVKQISDLFNNQYSNLLRCIHGAFNGNPRGIKTCMSMMARLDSLGRQLARTSIDPNGDPNIGPNGTPTFEYIANDILSSQGEQHYDRQRKIEL